MLKKSWLIARVRVACGWWWWAVEGRTVEMAGRQVDSGKNGKTYDTIVRNNGGKKLVVIGSTPNEHAIKLHAACKRSSGRWTIGR